MALSERGVDVSSAVWIFEILNRIEWLLQYSIPFETSTIIRNFRILRPSAISYLFNQNDTGSLP